MMDSEIEKARIRNLQGRLFPIHPREVCKQVGLNWLAALGLRDAGWLSCDPERVSELNEAQEVELRFLGALLAAGCDEQMLEQMLEGLKRPYSYRLRSLYYAWDERRWRLFPVNTRTLETVEEWIEDMEADENLGALMQVYEKIGDVISRLGTNGT